MSNVADAIALVSARSHYQARARELELQAATEDKGGRPLNARVVRNRSRIAQRAAIAELINPEPK